MNQVRLFFLWVIPFIVTPLFSSCNGKEGVSDMKSTSRPNVILIVSDDHGRGDLGCYGNTSISTPNLDYLASQGLRFDNAYCTTSSCSASRSVILTGLFNHANGQYGHQHSYSHFRTYETVRSLPVLLSESGYHTARIGKYHVGPEEVYRFDEALQGDSRNAVEMAENCRELVTGTEDKPFFLYFCTSDPHRGGGKVEGSRYRTDRFGNTGQARAGVEPRIFKPEEVQVPEYLPDLPATREELAQYYQSVSRVDQGVGRLIELLKEAGKWENTVIFYISDNGIAFHGAKTTLYDPGMHLPCIVRDPSAGYAGRSTSAMVSWVDITPTILDYAGVLSPDNSIPGTPQRSGSGVRAPSTFHGRSFIPVVKDPDLQGFDTIYASHTFHEITMYYPMKVVQTRKYKLIWNIAYRLPYPEASDLWQSATWQANLESGSGVYGKRKVDNYIHRPEFELYHMEADPDEINNLASGVEYREVLEDLKDRLKDFQQRTSDPWIIKWTHE
jgi:N-sulfoglucosamine sulfohydrolase